VYTSTMTIEEAAWRIFDMLGQKGFLGSGTEA